MIEARRPAARPVSGEQIAELLEKGARSHRRGDFNRALVCYRRVMRHAPDHAKAHHLAGLALLGRKKTGDLDLSIGCLVRAIELDDRQAAFYNDLGSAYWNKRRIDEALSAFLKSIELDPGFVQPNFNLGNCYWLLARYAEALEAYQRTVELDDNWAQAHYMIANCLLYLGRTDDALLPYDKAIEKRREFTDAHVGKAMALLKLGRWKEGWRHFQTRIHYPELSGFKSSTRPLWRGEDIRHESLLVYGEQGIGDVIQFVRFLPQVRARVGRLILACDARLHSLFRPLEYIDHLVDKDEVLDNVDQVKFDRRVLLMSLPALFSTTVDSIPGEVPYLEVDPALVGDWRRHLDARTFNVGLVWAGNPAQKDDRFRSCPLSCFSMMADVPNVTLYSLQTDEAREQILESNGPPLVDLANELTDFRSTAAAISALDLLVSVDTAAAHLAGALGRPVWNLLWYAHCWRYLEGRDTTPWYPTMRLFRQDTMGDWEQVVARVVQQLEEASSEHVQGWSK